METVSKSDYFGTFSYDLDCTLDNMQQCTIYHNAKKCEKKQ